ncbi:hypothetical protein, partial [Ornithobacterium rhinotracheale]
NTNTIQIPKELLMYIDSRCQAVFSFNYKSLRLAVLGHTTARPKLKNGVGYSHSDLYRTTFLEKKLSTRQPVP